MNACVSPEGETIHDSMWLCPIDLRKLHHMYSQFFLKIFNRNFYLELNLILKNIMKICKNILRNLVLKKKKNGFQNEFCT
jgi:hypothetical protein